jgi:hypothetical protein
MMMLMIIIIIVIIIIICDMFTIASNKNFNRPRLYLMAICALVQHATPAAQPAFTVGS